VIGGFIIGIYGSTFIMFVASVARFADGWRKGWGIARGRLLMKCCRRRSREERSIACCLDQVRPGGNQVEKGFRHKGLAAREEEGCH